MIADRDFNYCSRASRTLSRPSSWANRTGYTLLEILLALSLMTILVAAISITTGTFAQISKNGHLQVSRAITIDCIMDDLLMDIKAASRGASRSDSHLDSTRPLQTTDNSFSESTVGTERILQWDSSQDSRYVSLVGDANALLITRDGVNPRIVGGRDVQRADSTDAQQSLLWMSPTVSQATLACEVSGSQCINRTFLRPEGTTGLLRGYLRNNKLLVSSTENAVVETEFRYWDGKKWQETWNSFNYSDQLPLAIEIRIRLRNMPETWRRFTFQMEQLDNGGLR
jgi:prepilin-type N-terminal cleavage/methylation domain-containing protein